MKRFIVATLLVAVVLGAMLYFMPRSMYGDVLSYADDAQVTIYCRHTELSGIDTGLGRMVTCSVESLGDTLRSCANVDGLSVCFSGDMQDVATVIARLKADVVSVQQLGNLYVACLHSPRLSGGVIIDGKLVNAQIAYCCGSVTVGYPLILGEY